MESSGAEDAPGEQEQVAQVRMEVVDEGGFTSPSWPADLVELRRLHLDLGMGGLDADELVDFILTTRRDGGPLPELDEEGVADVDRLVELTLWARREGLNAEDVPAEATWVTEHAEGNTEAATDAGVSMPGESEARPSLASTPGGRLELRRELHDVMLRQGISGTTGVVAATSTAAAPVTGAVPGTAAPTTAATAPAGRTTSVPPRMSRTSSGPRSGTAPTPAVPSSSSTAVPIAPVPATALVTAPSQVSPGFQPIGSGAVPPAGTVPITSSPAATRWPTVTPAPPTSSFTPRGAIPSYGGVTIGSAPMGYSVAPPVQVTPPAVPVTTSAGVATVPTASSVPTAPTVPRPAVAGARSSSLPMWWSQVRARASNAGAVSSHSGPMPVTVPMAPTPVYYGGGLPVNTPVSSSYRAWPTPSGGTVPAPSSGPVGIRSSVKNAVDMINPFYSDGYTVERARTFWAEFERITRGMDDDLRMTVFRRCMKGKTGEDWWSHSRITDFETLRVRFHNRFLCISPPQMMERLKTTKRTRGESVEEWADRIRDLCDEASIFDPLMRYQYFLSGIRNSTWTVALQTTMVNSIEEAVTVLLFKNMQIPVERDEDFLKGGPSPKADTAVQGQLLSMMQQMQAMMSQQQQLMQAPRSPRGRSAIAPVQEAPMMSSGGNTPRQYGVSLAADQRTQEGVVVCGRCSRTGHGRATCPRQYGTCRRCQMNGHYSMECAVPADQLPKRNYNAQNQPPRKNGCLLCGSADHETAGCPLVLVLRNVAAREAQDASPAPATTTRPTRQ